MFLITSLDWEYFWPHFEQQDGRLRHFFSVMKSAYISLIIGPRVWDVKQTCEGNHGLGIFLCDQI